MLMKIKQTIRIAWLSYQSITWCGITQLCTSLITDDRRKLTSSELGYQTLGDPHLSPTSQVGPWTPATSRLGQAHIVGPEFDPDQICKANNHSTKSAEDIYSLLAHFHSRLQSTAPFVIKLKVAKIPWNKKVLPLALPL